MKTGSEARLTGPHEQDHNDDQHLACLQLLVPPHLLHGHLICGERDSRSGLLSSASHSSAAKPKILSACVYRCPHIYQKEVVALAGAAQWTERRPVNQKVAGSIPGQGTCLGCGPGPQLGVCKRQPIDVCLTHWCFSPFLPRFLPKSK